jgi:hypothetical protein
MSGSFRRLRPGRSGRRFGTFPLAVVMAAALLCSAHRQAVARDIHLTPDVPSDRSVLIREHAGWNEDCRAIAHPPLYLVSPPQHGKICARAQEIRITSIYAGTESQCIGRLVSGVKLIYQPDNSYSGGDTMVYAVQYPSRLRTISVKVTSATNAPGKLNVAETEFFVTTTQPRQMPGLVPDCPQFIF